MESAEPYQWRVRFEGGELDPIEKVWALEERFDDGAHAVARAVVVGDGAVEGGQFRRLFRSEGAPKGSSTGVFDIGLDAGTIDGAFAGQERFQVHRGPFRDVLRRFHVLGGEERVDDAGVGADHTAFIIDEPAGGACGVTKEPVDGVVVFVLGESPHGRTARLAVAAIHHGQVGRARPLLLIANIAGASRGGDHAVKDGSRKEDRWHTHGGTISNDRAEVFRSRGAHVRKGAKLRFPKL